MARRERIEIPEDLQEIPYVLYEMSEIRHQHRDRLHWTLHVVQAVILLITIIAFLVWPRKSVQPSGIYNLVDSHGVVVACDMAPEEIERILQSMQESGQED